MFTCRSLSIAKRTARRKKLRTIGMGRKKVNVEYIEDNEKRFLTFTKRLDGMFKKGIDLKYLTDSQVFIFVNYGNGEHIRHFSITGDFEQDISYLTHTMERVKESHGASCYEMTTTKDFIPDYQPDKNDNLFLEWKKNTRTSYIREPYLRANGWKKNTRLAKLMNKARATGNLKFNPDGTFIIPSNLLEDSQAPNPKKRKRKNKDKPIVEDDEEILQAVGEQPRKRKVKDASHAAPVQTPVPQVTFSSSVSNPKVQSMSITSDGCINLHQTDMRITHTNVKIKGLNLQSMADQFGLTENQTSTFRFSSGTQIRHDNTPPLVPCTPPPSPNFQALKNLLSLESIKPMSPSPQHLELPPPSPSFQAVRNMLPGVDNDELIAFLNNPTMSPVSIHERRFMEKQAREQMVGKQVAQIQNYDTFWEGLDYGSFFRS